MGVGGVNTFEQKKGGYRLLPGNRFPATALPRAGLTVDAGAPSVNVPTNEYHLMSEPNAIPLALNFTHYVKLGYHPIPVVPGDKIPSGGKGWNTKTYDFAKLDTEGWSVGICCNNVVGLDIDSTDEEQADEFERLTRGILNLPKNTPRRVGRPPKRLLICRVDSPIASWDITQGRGVGSTKFQLLGIGKMFVIQGIHKETKLPYTLNRKLPAWDKLPLVTAEQLEQLRVALGGRTAPPVAIAPESPQIGRAHV